MLVYDSTLRVPLIVAAPGVAAAMRDEAGEPGGCRADDSPRGGCDAAEAMKGRDLLGATVRLDTDVRRRQRRRSLQRNRIPARRRLESAAGADRRPVDGDPRRRRRPSSTTCRAIRGRSTTSSAAQPAVAAAMAARRRHDSCERRDVGGARDSRPRRRNGCARSATSPAQRSRLPRPARRIPATTIAAWNEFEDALGALNAHRPGRSGARSATLAAANPDAPVFQTTYARALKESGPAARRRSPCIGERCGAGRPTRSLLHDLAVAAREAANAAPGARCRPDAARRGDARRRGRARPRPEQRHGAERPRPARRRRGPRRTTRRRRSSARPRSTRTTPPTGPTSATRGARSAIATGAEQAYRRALDVDARAADAANGLGVLLVEAKRPAEAAPWFERAIAAAPRSRRSAAEPRHRAAGERTDALGRPTRIGRCSPRRRRYKRERDAASKLLAVARKRAMRRVDGFMAMARWRLEDRRSFAMAIGLQRCAVRAAAAAPAAEAGGAATCC